MKITLICATCVAILSTAVAVTFLHAEPQAPPRNGTPSGPPSGVAVVDVTYLLDHYAKLKQSNEQFKRDVEDKEVSLKKERELIQKKVELLKNLKPGSPDYKAKEEEIAQADSDWKIKVQRQRSDFAERESKSYLDAYKDISNQVRLYAERNGISLVLRFNGAPVDPNNRDAVQAEVFKMVTYYHKDIDITGPVMQELNKGALVPPTANRPQVGRPPQQPLKK